MTAGEAVSGTAASSARKLASTAREGKDDDLVLA
jgi:hypothetical protein